MLERSKCRRAGRAARIRSVAIRVAVAVGISIPLVAPPADAQYFGRNKVRYRSFDFKVLETDHFDIYYYPEEADAARDVAVMAERWYDRLSRALNHQLGRRQPLILYASHPDFEQTNAIPGDIGEGTGGVTEYFKRRIVLPMAGPRAETEHVVAHELVHAFQYDIVGRGQGVAGLGGDAISRLPLWFVEGMAEYLSVGPEDANTAMWMRDAAHAGKLPSYGRLADPRYFPYRYGQAVWAYIAGRWGEDAVGKMLDATRGTGDAARAIRTVLAAAPDTLVMDWHKAVEDWTAPVAGATDTVAPAARLLFAAKHRGGHLNVAPALSPDGSKLVFFSERNRFSIEMYLADVATARIERTITRTSVDPHFQSLEFINSAGAWSPDGRRLAFAAVSHGRPLLALMDVATGKTEREFPLDELGEILTPTWSPDGRRVAFSALQGGYTDLWVLDVESGEARRLTHDAWAELEPAWSPDGRSIALVTDRYAPAAADSGAARASSPYRLALMDPESGELRPLAALADGKHIDPQWSADGSSLYFVSDHGGISNVYRVPVDGGAAVRITNLLTGVSGITALSPALSVSRDGSRMAFSVFEKGDYNLYAIERPDSLEALPTALRLVEDPARLPAAAQRAGGAAPTATSAVAMRSDTLSMTRRPYRSGLSLDYVGSAGVGVAAGSGGVAVGGGAALYWSDMLGNHNLVTLLQVVNAGGNPLNNITAGVGYENRRARWTWGGEISQFPYISTAFTEDDSIANGIPLIRDSTYRFWQIDRTFAGNLSYAFHRFQRVEFSAGLRNITFASEAQEQVYDGYTGQLLRDETSDIPTGLKTLNLATVGSALVYDSSIFGGTSPILGQSYRMGGTLIEGTLRFHELLADYRRYVMPVRPLTIAGRVLHFGRYGRDGDSGELNDLFIGYPWLMRGYNDASFSASECYESGGDGNSCPTFDRLLGTRFAVANLELRLPLLGALGVIPSGGFLPVELATFLDSGVAWRGNDKPTFLGGDRKLLTSAGLALRVNLFGLTVGELDFVHPNDRPGKGWYWQFSLQPGF